VPDKAPTRNRRTIPDSKMLSRRLQWTYRGSFKSSVASFCIAHHICMYQHSHSHLPTLQYRDIFLHVPNTLCVSCRRDMNWPAVQTVLREHTDSVSSFSFSPDSTHIVTGSEDNTVRLWDAGTGQPVNEPLRGHTSFATSFSLDDSRIVTGSRDNAVRLWDAPIKQPSQQCALSDPLALPDIIASCIPSSPPLT
jgi:WD40 repeat protein